MEKTGPREVSIWWWAFGYFAAYAPYTAVAKALTDGKLGPKVPGNRILPLATAEELLEYVCNENEKVEHYVAH